MTNLKKTLLLSFVVFSFQIVSAQTFQWAKKFESVGNSISTGCYPYSIITDAASNVYTTGFIQDTTDFDPGPNIYNLAPPLHHAIFISKLDANGNFVWAKSMGNLTQIPSGHINTGYDIVIGPSGNVYVTGSYSGVIDFDPGPSIFNLNVPANNYYQRNFILKLDPNGNFIWAKDMGSTNSNCKSFSIKIDDLGNVITTGQFGATVDFDPGVGVHNISSSGGFDIFISKLDSNGNFVWAKSIGSSTTSENVHDLVLDAKNNIIITGRFIYQCDFDPNAGTHFLNAPNGFNVFVLKLNSLGNFVWAKQYGNAPTILARNLYCDAFDNIYSVGSMKGTHNFDPSSSTFNLTATGNSENTFISKLDSNGSFAWARIFNQGQNFGFDITGDALGNVFISGNFRDSVDFDPGIGKHILTSSGNADLYISKLDINGNFVWTKQTEGGATGIGSDITIDPLGYIHTTGHFFNSVDFDPSIATHILSNSIISNQTDATAFVFKLKDCNNPTYSNITQSACDSFTMGNQVFINSGTYNVVMANTAGCDSVITLNLTINTIDTSVLQSGTTLTANQGGATYQWINCDNYVNIPGATAQSYTANINGNYAVIISNNGCIDTTDCLPINSVTVNNYYDEKV